MASNVGISERDTEIRLPRATAVKNKSAAPKQVRPARRLQCIRREYLATLQQFPCCSR